MNGVTAGPYTDAITGERHLLIEDLGGLPLTELAAVCAGLHREHPGAESTLLRTAPGVELPAPWRRHLTYVRCPEEVREPEGGPEVNLAMGPVDEELVRIWLAEAFTAAGADLRRPVSETVARAGAEAVCELPDRVSLMARRDGRTIGHATLRTDSADPVTGEVVAELVDILVDGVPDTGFVTDVLSAAAIRYARALGRVLLGNVVHTARGDKDTANVVEGLLAQGWTVDHEFWWAPAPNSLPVPGTDGEGAEGVP